jgi:hypothetical protein
MASDERPQCRLCLCHNGYGTACSVCVERICANLAALKGENDALRARIEEAVREIRHTAILMSDDTRKLLRDLADRLSDRLDHDL